MNALAEAWDAALDARPDDQGPWRVLADLLLSRGDAQGELMHLELDRELAPLRGLSRGRHAELLRAQTRLVAPPGLTLQGALVHRGALLQARGDAAALTGPADDPKWHGLQRLWLHYPPTPAPAPRTPLAGATLRRVTALGLLTPEALDVLAQGPPRAHLASLALHCLRPQGSAPWERRWKALLPAHPRLRRVSFTADWWDETVRPAPLREEWLDPLAGAALDEVTVSLGPVHLADLVAWRRRRATAFTLVADLGPRLPLLEVHAAALVFRAAASPRPADVVAAEHFVRSAWPASAGAPPPVRWDKPLSPG